MSYASGGGEPRSSRSGGAVGSAIAIDAAGAVASSAADLRLDAALGALTDRSGSNRHPVEGPLELAKLLAAGHHAGDFLAADLALAEESHWSPAVQEHEAVADRIGVADIVGNEDHAQSLVAGL